MEPLDVAQLSARITSEIQKRVVGLDYAIKDVLTCFYANGHVLLEGVPGVAKTRLASTLAEVLGMDFARIQFTPDLMPADITGTTIYNMKEQEFRFVKGPVFTNILLCDEINRAPPKTQSALLEAMQERQVSMDGKTYPLPTPFLTLATQNPIEQTGVYPLPEAQLDRFLIRQFITYPSAGSEVQMLQSKRDEGEWPVIQTVASAADILAVQQCVATKVTVSDKILQYIVQLVRKSREMYGITFGGGPRASIALLNLCRARAALEGRDFVQPDDVKRMLFPVLNHRLILTAEAELESVNVSQIINEILETIQVVI